jgi:transposase
MPRGARHPNARLTDDDVREIRKLWDNGNGPYQREIAERFGIAASEVSAIVNRRRWAHVD